MRRLAILCAATMAAVTAAPAHGFSVQSGLFPPSPVTQGGRNQNAEPGMTVDGGGTFFAAGNISGFNPRQEPRGGTVASGIDIWRSTDGARSFRWVGSPFNVVNRLPGLGGDDVD